MKHDKETIIREVKSWILTVILPVLVVFLLNLFICKLAIVSGSSMYPTLHHRDVLVVWMLDDSPENGDIVVVNTDENGIMAGEKIVKRVIATEGQTLRIDYEENAVYVDGSRLEEDYINHAEDDPMLAYYDDVELTVPEGHVYVMGDNRNHSMDSRDVNIGMVAKEDILGIEVVRIPVGEWLENWKNG